MLPCGGGADCREIRENGSGKIKTFKAVKNGKEVSVIVDSRGRIKELQ
jgi:hypothetical protein